MCLRVDCLSSAVGVEVTQDVFTYEPGVSPGVLECCRVPVRVYVSPSVSGSLEMRGLGPGGLYACGTYPLLQKDMPG